jgi:mRNA interferase RelE/StbE
MSGPNRYTIRLKPSAEKEMDRLPGSAFDRVAAAILALEDAPRPPGCKKLRGLDEYRVRVGPYRILYLIDDRSKQIEIVSVGHRREVYRGK